MGPLPCKVAVCAFAEHVCVGGVHLESLWRAAFSILLVLWALAAASLPLSICLCPGKALASRRGCFTFTARLKVQLGTNPTDCAFQSQPYCVGYLYPEGNISQRARCSGVWVSQFPPTRIWLPLCLLEAASVWHVYSRPGSE